MCNCGDRPCYGKSDRKGRAYSQYHAQKGNSRGNGRRNSEVGVAEAVIPAGQNGYKTDPDRPRSIFSKIFLRPKATFYFQVFWIVWTNSRKALKGLYSAEKWAESSFDIMRALKISEHFWKYQDWKT